MRKQRVTEVKHLTKSTLLVRVRARKSKVIRFLYHVASQGVWFGLVWSVC